jgi:hypothetical protein
MSGLKSLLSEWITGLTFCISHQPFASLQKRMPIGEYKGAKSAYNWAALYRKRFTAMLRYRRSLKTRVLARDPEILVQRGPVRPLDMQDWCPPRLSTKDQLADGAARCRVKEPPFGGLIPFSQRNEEGGDQEVYPAGAFAVQHCAWCIGANHQFISRISALGPVRGLNWRPGSRRCAMKVRRGSQGHYIGGDPNVVDDEVSTIANDPTRWRSRGIPFNDHTGSTDGRMMVINAEQPTWAYSQRCDPPLIGNNRTITISAYRQMLSTVTRLLRHHPGGCCRMSRSRFWAAGRLFWAL